jgi:hypothetical protein
LTTNRTRSTSMARSFGRALLADIDVGQIPADRRLEMEAHIADYLRLGDGEPLTEAHLEQASSARHRRDDLDSSIASVASASSASSSASVSAAHWHELPGQALVHGFQAFWEARAETAWAEAFSQLWRLHFLKTLRPAGIHSQWLPPLDVETRDFAVQLGLSSTMPHTAPLRRAPPTPKH